MKADGSVLIDTKIMTGGMEKGFELIKDEMSSVGITAKQVGKQIELSFSKMDVSKPIANAVAKVEQLERQLSSISSDYRFSVSEGDDKEAERLAAKRIAIYDRLEAAREKLSIEISAAVQREAEAEEKASRRAIKAAEKEAEAKKRIAEKQYRDLTKPARRFNSRLREILSGALVFNLLSSGLREMTSYFGTALKANNEFTASFAKLKGALLTAFQPIYELVLPAVIYLMRVLTALVQVVGSFFASITGKSAAQMSKNAQALNKQAGAIQGVGNAAEKAAKQLAGFDEINRLESIESGNIGGAGGESGSDEIVPNFEPIEITEELERILALVGSIGAGLLAWKIASMFTDSLSVAAGLGLAVGGALVYAYNWADAFANGINWDNLTGMMTGMLVLAGGLALAFGSVGAAVGLIIGSIGLVIATVEEFNRTGEVTNEMLAALALAIAGIGAAISLVTGNWLPLIIGMLAAFGVTLGATNEDVRNFVEGVISWFLELWEWLKDIFQAIVDNWNSIWSGINQYQTTGTIGPQAYSAASAFSVYSRTPEIPQLAKGAVIPPNKKFMAVLGDQTHGTNLEAPEDLIRQIVREETGRDDRLVQLMEMLISVVEEIEIGDETIGRAAERYTRKTARARGV